MKQRMESTQREKLMRGRADWKVKHEVRVNPLEGSCSRRPAWREGMHSFTQRLSYKLICGEFLPTAA